MKYLNISASDTSFCAVSLLHSSPLQHMEEPLEVSNPIDAHYFDNVFIYSVPSSKMRLSAKFVTGDLVQVVGVYKTHKINRSGLVHFFQTPLSSSSSPFPDLPELAFNPLWHFPQINLFLQEATCYWCRLRKVIYSLLWKTCLRILDMQPFQAL